MAVSANTVWEFRASATANMVNGGGFVTGASGVDYSQQDAAQYALTGITSAGAGNTILTASAAADMVGNIIHTVSGTNFTNNSWFEITSVVVGTSITCGTNGAGASISTGVGATGVMNVGGALSLNSTLDDDFFEQVVGGNIVWVKNGSYTFGEAISVASTLSDATNPSYFMGYNATRGDDPTGSSRPLLQAGTSLITFGQDQWFFNFRITGTSGAIAALGSGGSMYNVSSFNSSTTAGRAAITVPTDASAIRCEAVSQNGNAYNLNNTGAEMYGCYAHDSNVGVAVGSTRCLIGYCLIESNKTTGIDMTSSTGFNTFTNNTIYGAQVPVSVGIALASGSSNHRLYNNIFYGLTTGVSQAAAQLKSNTGDYNNFFNNTTNATNYTLSETDLTLDPQFVGASQLTGATATTSGSVLTQSGGDFSSVTDNVDYLRVTSGTGVTTGIYLITSHTSTTVTVNNPLGTSSAGDVVWTIPVGHNFAIGTNLKAAGFPGLFPGSETTGYLDTGAVQRQESASGGGGGFFIS